MKWPVCGTNGIEGGVCFYCEAKKVRKKKRGKADAEESTRKDTRKKD